MAWFFIWSARDLPRTVRKKGKAQLEGASVKGPLRATIGFFLTKIGSSQERICPREVLQEIIPRNRLCVGHVRSIVRSLTYTGGLTFVYTKSSDLKVTGRCEGFFRGRGGGGVQSGILVTVSNFAQYLVA